MPIPTRPPGARAPARAPVPIRPAAVVVQVPADKDYVVLIRSAAGHLGALLGCTAPEIADLRLAVDEACALLLASQPPTGLAAPSAGQSGQSGQSGQHTLECRISVRPGSLDIVVTAPPGDVAGPGPDSFGWNILAALVDELSWSLGADSARIELVKVMAASPP